MKLHARLLAVIACLAMASTAWPQKPQKMDSLDRDRALQMITSIADDVRKQYYDPKLRGFDLDGRIRDARAKIQGAASLDEALAIVAWTFDGLEDSHTFFLPPRRTLRVDYGFRMRVIGDRTYIMAVRPESDAAGKGLKRGEELVAVNGYPPVREILWKMNYLYKILRPQPVMELQVRDQDGKERKLVISAKMRQKGPHVVDFARGGGGDLWDIVREMEDARRSMRPQYRELSDALLIVKLPTFMLSTSEVDSILGRASKYSALIVDLRDNPGGSVEALERLTGGFFERDVKIADRVGRQSKKPLVAKSAGRGFFAGKVVVLVDSGSGSASELFARTLQLEKRGIIVGDRSAGSVMEAKRFSYKVGVGYVVYYGAQISESDLIMADGKSLERSGVVPDEILLPKAGDIAAGRDPVLAHAAEILGVHLTPEKAGEMFPFEWPNE